MIGLASLPGSATAAGLDDPVDQWLPSHGDATWTYRWDDTHYAKTPTLEKYTVTGSEGTTFRLAWTTRDVGNAEGAVDSSGTMDYRRTDAGLVNLSWTSTPPPPEFPILCPDASGCANSLAGTHYMLIWGNRSPVLLEPLLRGSRWTALGGADNDVASSSRYAGQSTVKVPAFPNGIRASKVVTEITQAGALGDPYGSGIRTVWWVRGVGPVQVRFLHAGGEVTKAELVTTNTVPRAAPPDERYLPFDRGDRQRFRWRNSKHMRRPSIQQLTVREVVNNTARVEVRSIRAKKGPLRVEGAYLFATRLSGVVNLAGATRGATRRSRFPDLGPRSQPRDRRRRLLTPLDFLSFGFSPILPAHPAKGDAWRSKRPSRDYSVFGVTGRTKVLGVRRIRTPRGRVRALGVRSHLRQPGFRFGSGVRTSWFVAGRGLVKLVFRHRDGSVSRVDRIR